MAVSQFTTWNGEHTFTNFVLIMNYAVFADMSNGSAQPYIRLSNCRVRSARDNYSQLGSRAPITIGLQINGAGTSYTFSSGSNIQHHEGMTYDMDTGEYIDGFYYIDFSSGVNVNIPKNATPFTINLTVTTRNGESYSITEHACGPLSNTLNGPTSMYTGNVVTYTLQNAVRSDNTFCVNAIMSTRFVSGAQNAYDYMGYATPYRPVYGMATNFNTISFVPLRNDATVGDVARPNTDGYNYIEYACYYWSDDLTSGSIRHYKTKPKSGAIVISYQKIWITVTARAEVNAALKPEFYQIFHSDTRVASQIQKYGGVIQNHATYDVRVKYLDSDFTAYNGFTNLKYGSSFYTSTVTDYLGASTAVSHPAGKEAYITYKHGLLTKPGNNLVVQYNLVDTFGFTSTYTDRITVLPYTNPQLTTHSVRRCSPVESGSGTDIYEYDGQLYQVDDYGEYALIEWSVNITSLDEKNSRRLSITGPGARTITLTDYICSGYYVAAADGERSYDCVFTLQDDFETVKHTEPLNTILAAIDFRRGGTGIALGKVAETDNTMDVHRNWLLKMPYNTQVGNYSGNTSVRLRDWMASVESRMQGIIDNRDIIIYGYARTESGTSPAQFWDGNTAVCIPSGNGTVTYPSDLWQDNIVLDNLTYRADTTGMCVGVLIGDNLTVTRNYLYIPTVEIPAAYCGAGSTPSGPVPGVYICSTKPTSINQSTGRPNATIIASRQYTGQITYHGGSTQYNDEYISYIGYGYIYGDYYDVSSYQGRKIWVCVVTRNGGTSPHALYTLNNASVRIATGMKFTNHRS